MSYTTGEINEMIEELREYQEDPEFIDKPDEVLRSAMIVIDALTHYSKEPPKNGHVLCVTEKRCFCFTTDVEAIKRRKDMDGWLFLPVPKPPQT